jgi:hypothetical protein
MQGIRYHSAGPTIIHAAHGRACKGERESMESVVGLTFLTLKKYYNSQTKKPN